MKILVLADVESKYLWDYFEKEKLEGIDLILSCGDLKADYLSFLASFSKVPILYVREGIEHTRQVIASIGKGKSIGIFIGPEGGFDKDELELATNAGADIITLGRRILRTETAGLMLMSVLMYNMEE